MNNKYRSLCKMKWFQEALEVEHQATKQLEFLHNILKSHPCEFEIINAYSNIFQPSKCVFCALACYQTLFVETLNKPVSAGYPLACRVCILGLTEKGCNKTGKELYKVLQGEFEEGGYSQK